MIKSELKEIEFNQVKEDNFQQLIKRLNTSEKLLFQPSHSQEPLEKEAVEYLQFTNPRLLELKERYKNFSSPLLDASQWTQSFVYKLEQLQYFRGDYVYLWQFRDLNTELHYWITTYYLKTIDSLGLLELLEEDKLFGAYTFTTDNITVSRDLLDSISEISFLERTLKISTWDSLKILDIGAGYGRLAYRMVKALPNIERFFCVDTIAESTFTCEYYLRFRGINDLAITVPIDELDDILSKNSIDLAVNIHSFSECTFKSIIAWLDIIKKYEIKYLMIVPNQNKQHKNKLLSTEKDYSGINFLPVIESLGYELIVYQPKYLDPVLQKHGITTTYYYLFQLVKS